MLTKNVDKCLSANPDFIYDEACLDVVTDRKVNILAQYLECKNCSFQNWFDGSSNNTSFLVNTKYQLQFKAEFDNTSCIRTLRFDEHARYGWNITNGNCSQFYVKQAADNAYLPILGAFIIFFCFGTLWYMVKCIYRCTHNRFRFTFLRESSGDVANEAGGSGGPAESAAAPLVVEQAPGKRKHPQRIKSLDVFRGLAIVLMIFVNYGGGQYWFFHHSIWNGLTVADLVFPWFAWIMGMSMSVSLRARLRSGEPRKQMALHVCARSAVLVLLGVLLNSHEHHTQLGQLRLPGVLQRLGLVYLLVGLLETAFAKRAHAQQGRERVWWGEDVWCAWRQWAVVLSLAGVHACVTFLLPVPGCPTGFLEPGGLQFGGRFQNCTGGAAGHIDRLVFGSHMYTNPSCRRMYETKASYDPEGILGTLNTVLTVYLGVQAGRILTTYNNMYARVYRWAAWAAVTGLAAGALCGFSKEGGVIPLNKNLWSLSFALGVSSLAGALQAVLHVLVDCTHRWGGRPFCYPGMNALLLYVGHCLTRCTFPFAWLPAYRTHRELLIMNLWGTALWVAISIVLYKRNIFFKI